MRTLLSDAKDPTVALFISEGAANKAARLVQRNHPKRVSKSVPKRRTRQGQVLGYQVINHFTNGCAPSPLTNGDFERLQRHV